MKSQIKRKTLILLWIAGIAGSLMAIPFLLHTVENLSIEAQQYIPVPLIVISSLIQSAVLIGLAVFIGLKINNRFKFSILALKMDFSDLFRYIIYGLIAGLSLLIMDYLFHSTGSELTFFSYKYPPIWKGFMACFYGGIVEEILMRLLLVNLFGLIIITVFPIKQIAIESKLWFLPISLAAILFALGHLPLAAIQTILTFDVVLRVLLFNTLAGLIFGYIYWKEGLVPAIISHFTADFLLYVIFPLIK